MFRSGFQYSLNSLRFRRACPGSGRQVEATLQLKFIPALDLRFGFIPAESAS